MLCDEKKENTAEIVDITWKDNHTSFFTLYMACILCVVFMGRDVARLLSVLLLFTIQSSANSNYEVIRVCRVHSRSAELGFRNLYVFYVFFKKAKNKIPNLVLF